ncbi:MAG: hypothetical protein ACI8QC_000613 [Planctomycetota bacterium]|jgi:hypothetical protein
MLLKCLLPTLLAAAFVAPSCQTVDATSAIEFHGLMQTLDDGEQDQIDRPLGVGLVVVGMPVPDADVPAAFEYGFQYMHDSGGADGVNQETSSNLVWAGVRAEMWGGTWRPHFGAGLMGISTHIRRRRKTDRLHASDEMRSLGFYFEVGITLRATSRWHLGLGLRQSIGLRDHLEDTPVDLDFVEVYGSLGYSF